MMETIASATLITAYSLLAIVSLLMVIYSRGFSKILAMALILIVGGFGVFLVNVPRSYMGWPTSEELPDGCFIRDVAFVEPTSSRPGAIYIWAFIKMDSGLEPRMYKLPYHKPDHEELIKKRGEAHKVGGLLQYRKGMKKGEGSRRGDGEKDDSGYRVINPNSILEKTN